MISEEILQSLGIPQDVYDFCHGREAKLRPQC
jgi:hypothetical protein